MSIEYIDHAADVGLRADGPTIEAAFCEAARGLFGVMVDLDAVAPHRRHDIDAAADDPAELLVDWMSGLLAQKELTGLVFSRFEAEITLTDSGCTLRGTGWGEPLDPGRHRPAIEVKGISYLGLAVHCEAGRWRIECVLDV